MRETVGLPPADLYDAAKRGALDRVRELLKASRQLVNSYSAEGFTPLMLAAHSGHAALVTFLLDQGAQLAAEARNPMRVQALHAAVAGRHTPVAELLLMRGADANARQQDAITPLHQAAQHGQADMIRLLLTYGANPRAMMNNGKLPRDLARDHGHAEAAALLEPR